MSHSLPLHLQALAQIVRDGGALCTLAAIEGSYSRRVGAQLAIAPDGSVAGDLADHCLERELVSQVRRAAEAGAAHVLRIGEGSPLIDFRLPCGSSLDILIDPAPDTTALAECYDRMKEREAARCELPAGPLNAVVYTPQLRIHAFGGEGECAALQALAAPCGVEVLCHHDGLSLGQPPDHIHPDPYSAVVCLFHDHEWERAILPWALRSEAFFTGAIGGARARAERAEMLREAGFVQSQIAPLARPIGLIPQARDPATLALSILAETVQRYEALRSA
ncbi:uncharacterized protein HME9302_01500 [Alteripontixanthobacter maritimus]|uniref:Xanthine dehydrogenase n=1 Tax=Alteripontixanthobacter maritimus TaxID=2161824 RepID=A0A369QBL0_9SPHN|nr:XdhC family protein [Alteripontixanthobacter maritimus]RDC60299.1 uncharacterized protein HME9302_01500 [Alteripontixanthobacter maritimus]